jgi:hypothetical protein
MILIIGENDGTKDDGKQINNKQLRERKSTTMARSQDRTSRRIRTHPYQQSYPI